MVGVLVAVSEGVIVGEGVEVKVAVGVVVGVGTGPSVSVELLLDGSGSVTSDGGVTTAVFTRLPVAEGLTAPCARKAPVSPARRLTVGEVLSPEPLGAPQLAPEEAEPVQVSPEIPAGPASLTVPPV